MKLCVTVALYALAKEYGAREAARRFRDQVMRPGDDSLPCVRVIARLRELEDVVLFPDFGGSAVPKMRTRAAHVAHKCGADVWISVDDDLEAPGDTLRDLIVAVAGDAPAVCLAPYFLRGSETVSVGIEPGHVAMPRELGGGGRVVRCLAGGFGLVAVNRALLERMRDEHPELAFVDDDGEEKIGLFREVLERRRWWNEDLSFFRRVPADARVECLIAGATSHDGALLDCSHAPQLPCILLPDWATPVRVVVEVTPSTPPEPAPESAPPVLEHGAAADEGPMFGPFLEDAGELAADGPASERP